MLVSKDLASSGNIRRVWNHHLDYFGACCSNIFSWEIRHPFLRKPTSEQVSIFHYLHGTFSTDHDITFNLFVMRTKEIPSFHPNKKVPTPNQWQSTFWEQNPGFCNFLPFFFPTKDFLPTGAVPKPFPPWAIPPLNPPRSPRLARWPRQDTWQRWIRISYKKTLGCLELQ